MPISHGKPYLPGCVPVCLPFYRKYLSLRAIALRGLMVRGVVMLLWFGVMAEALACTQSAVTPFEKAYCDIKAKGYGKNLPRFDDFRRNPPQTQKLLLKRPAKEAGIELPKAAAKKPKAPRDSQRAARQQDSPPAKRHTPAGLRGCQAAAKSLRCGTAVYNLLDNRGNKTLSPQAFTEANPLVLPQNNGLGTHRYLQSIYPQYLSKMHDIGLAGVTLSYSKLFYIYEEARAQNQDFSARMKTMYHFLKKDKQAMAANRRHRGKAAPPLKSCDIFGADYIVCDWQGANWVYLRQ